MLSFTNVVRSIVAMSSGVCVSSIVEMFIGAMVSHQ